MLVLSRKKNEAVILRDQDGRVIGEVIVSEIRPGKVQLGFRGFDLTVAIHRSELIGSTEATAAASSPRCGNG